MADLIQSKLNINDIDVIVSPAMGGVVIGSKIGEELQKQSIFLERVDGNLTLRRGFDIKKGLKVIIVEDVITQENLLKNVLLLCKSIKLKF